MTPNEKFTLLRDTMRRAVLQGDGNESAFHQAQMSCRATGKQGILFADFRPVLGADVETFDPIAEVPFAFITADQLSQIFEPSISPDELDAFYAQHPAESVLMLYHYGTGFDVDWFLIQPDFTAELLDMRGG